MAAVPIEMAALTDVGRSRPHNEDAHYIDTHLRLALLCDGMGGYSSGEVASAAAIETIVNGVRDHASPDRILGKIDTSSGLTHAAMYLREQILIATFVVVVIGGLGSVRGAFVGALLAGLVDTLARAFVPGLLKQVFAPTTADALGAGLASAAIYLLMALVLVFRPRGLLPA